MRCLKIESRSWRNIATSAPRASGVEGLWAEFVVVGLIGQPCDRQQRKRRLLGRLLRSRAGSPTVTCSTVLVSGGRARLVLL